LRYAVKLNFLATLEARQKKKRTNTVRFYFTKLRSELAATQIAKNVVLVIDSFDGILCYLVDDVRPPHSPTPVPVLTVSGAADAKANS
jgi:hypothetical protein